MLLTPSCLIPLFHLFLSMPGVFSFLLPGLIRPEALDALRGSRTSEFVKLLGIPNADLCKPETDKKSDPMFNEDLAFGDLMMNEKEIKEAEIDEDDGDYANDAESDYAEGGPSEKRKEKKSGRKPKKWPSGIIPYYISNDFNREQKRKIEDAIQEMNSKIRHIHFRPFKRSDRNYIMIFSGKGCYGNVGMKGGPQAVSLQADKCLEAKGTIQHELLHILGFRHEQNRHDRDDYVEILYDNIPEKWHINYKRYNPSQGNCVGDYDYYSVLHYPLIAPTTEGRKYAFRILDSNVDTERIGSRERMSKMDIQKADELYTDESDEDKSH